MCGRRRSLTSADICISQRAIHVRASQPVRGFNREGLDPAEMEVMWSTHGPPDAHDLDFGATPVFVNSMIVDGAKDGNVYAMDAASGRFALENGGLESPMASSLALSRLDGTHIFVPYVDGATGGAVVALGLDGSVFFGPSTTANRLQWFWR